MMQENDPNTRSSGGGGMNNYNNNNNNNNNNDYSEEEALEHACRIWFCAPEGRAARELQSLNTEDREKVWADMTANEAISNYRGIPEEDPQMVQRAIKELSEELLYHFTNLSSTTNTPTTTHHHHHPSQPQPHHNNNPNANTTKGPGAALSYVLYTKPNYVLNPTFLLRFLRANDFHIRNTIALLIRHFDFKQELFGSDKLGRDIVYSDLTAEDLEFLHHGVYQYLKGTDRAGRHVSMLNFSDPNYQGRYAVLRSMFYMNMSISELESVQKLGIVRTGYFHYAYPRGGPDNELIRYSMKIIDCVPIKCVALYLMYESSLWSSTMELIIFFVSPFVRVRTRFLGGSYYEHLYELYCLGIPNDSVPVKEDGTIRTENLMEWLEQRRSLEYQRQRHRQREQQEAILLVSSNTTTTTTNYNNTNIMEMQE